MRYLDVPQIRWWLQKYDVLHTDEHERLLKFGDDKTSTTAKEMLINMLRSKGAKGLYHFVDALKQTTSGTGHDTILRDFQDDPDVEEMISSFIRTHNL